MMNIVNKGGDRHRVTFDDVRRTEELNYLFVSPLIIGHVHHVFEREGLYDNDGLIICSPDDKRIPKDVSIPKDVLIRPGCSFMTRRTTHMSCYISHLNSEDFYEKICQIVNGWDTENNECIDDRNHESFQQWVKDNPDEAASLHIKPAPHPKDRKRKI